MNSFENGSFINGSASVSYINAALIRFSSLILLSTLLVPSILLSSYIFYWIIRIPALGRHLKNHIVILIFLICFIQVTCEMPFLLKYLNSGYVPFYSFKFCKFWIAFDYSLNTTILFLNSCLSVERYLFIFHNNLLNRRKVLLHYIPVISLVIIANVYSYGTVLFFPCREVFYENAQLCGGPCYQLDPVMGTFDIVFTIFLPLGCITFFNCFLGIRVLLQKRRMIQNHVWKRNFGMLLQLISISILHVTIWLPAITVVLIVMTTNSPSEIVLELQSSWLLTSLVYIAVLLNPCVCIFAIPEIKVKFVLLVKAIRRQRERRVHGVILNEASPPAANTNQASRLQGHQTINFNNST